MSEKIKDCYNCKHCGYDKEMGLDTCKYEGAIDLEACYMEFKCDKWEEEVKS